MWRPHSVSEAMGAIAVVAMLGGCMTLIPGVSPHNIQRDAAAQERARCGPEPVDPRLYSVGIVENVAPLYEHVMGGPNGTESRTGGAEVTVRPLPGVTAELLERGLMCRSAQLMLGHAAPAPNEPYYLLDGWVRIDVRPGSGNFIVRLSAEDAEHGREILAKARAFAGVTALKQ